MKREEILMFVKQQLVELSEKELNIDDLTEETNPVDDLGLDSYDGVAYACLLEDRFVLPADINPFVNDENQTVRTIGDITDLLTELVEQEASINE